MVFFGLKCEIFY